MFNTVTEGPHKMGHGLSMAASAPSVDRRRYQAPSDDLVSHLALASLVEGACTTSPQQRGLPGHYAGVVCVGYRELAEHKSVVVVGSRKVC